MKYTSMLFGLAVAAAIVVNADITTYTWRNVATGDYTNADCWNPMVVPLADYDQAEFNFGGANSDFVVRIPAGTTVNSQAYFHMGNLGANGTFTFDVTGAIFNMLAAHYPSDWQGFMFSISSSSHFFNFEGVDKKGTSPIVQFDNTKLIVSGENGSNVVDLVQGKILSTNINGVAAKGNLLVGGNSKVALFRMHDGTEINVNQYIQRGGAAEVYGGNHRVYGSLQLANAYANKVAYTQTGGTMEAYNVYVCNSAGADAYLTVMGGEFTQPYNTSGFRVAPTVGGAHVLFGGTAVATLGRVMTGNVVGSTEEFVITDSAKVDMSNLQMANAAGAVSAIDISGNAEVTMLSVNDNDGSARIGRADGASAIVTVGGNAKFSHTMSDFYVGGHTPADAEQPYTLLAKDNATVTLDAQAYSKSMYVQGGGLFQLTDNAVLNIFSSLYLQGGKFKILGDAVCNQNRTFKAESGSEAEIGGEATWYQNNSISVDNNSSLTIKDNAKVIADEGSLQSNGEKRDARKFNVGGTLTIAGGEHYLGIFNVPSLRDVSAAMYVTGGKIVTHADTSGAYVPLTVGGIEANGLYEQTGGEVTVPRMVRVGYNNVSPYTAIFRMKGGKFTIEDMGNNCVFNICDNNSLGTVELLGGILKLGQMRGWTGSPKHNHSATGWAKFYGNGGTLQPQPSTSTILCDVDEAIVGENGLIVDTLDQTINVNQEFVDEEGKDGRVVKVGSGTLKAITSPSAHAITEVREGTYIPLVAFGRNLVVKSNGATVDLTQLVAPEFESISLGDSNGVGTLIVANGQTITITGEHGLSFENGVLQCEEMIGTQGEYTLFRCTDAVALEDLKGLRLKNQQSNCIYTWKLEEDDGATLVKLLISEQEVTDSTWVGTDGDWTKAENWDPVLPGGATRAIFPADSAVKTLSFNDTTANAYTLDVKGGEWTMGGAQMNANSIIVAAGATVEVNAPVKPFGPMYCEVGALGLLKLNSGIDDANDCSLVQKAGSGVMEINEVQHYTGAWFITGGTLEVNVENVLGVTNPDFQYMTIGPATLKVNVAQEVTRDLNFNPGTARAAIIDAEEDISITGVVKTQTGGLLKYGNGTLTLNINGTQNKLSADNMNNAANSSPQTPIVLVEGGDAPAVATANNSPLGGLSILEGKMVINGTTKGSKVSQKHNMIIAGNYAARTNPTLELTNVTMDQGGSGMHMYIGGVTPANTMATHPTLVAVNSSVISDGVKLGSLGHFTESSLLSTPTLYATNSTVQGSWSFDCGVSGDDLIISTMYASGSVVGATDAAGGGVTLNGYCDFHLDGSQFVARKSGSNGFYVNQNAHGLVEFTNGSELAVNCFKASAACTAMYDFEFVFDASKISIANVTASAPSVINGLTKRRIVVNEGGMEFNVPNGTHVFSVPLTGEGLITKIGAGELYLPKAIEKSNNVLKYVDGVTLVAADAMKVAQGALTLEAGAAQGNLAVEVAADATLNVAGSQTLGTISGSGTVQPSAWRSNTTVAEIITEGAAEATTLTCKIAADEDAANVPLFTNLALDGVTVDMGAGDEQYPVGTKLAVCRLGEGTSATPANWKSTNCGPMSRASFAVEDGVVYGTVHRQGFMFLVR